MYGRCGASAQAACGGVLQVELAARAGRISELEQGAVSREQFEEVQKELQDQRLETRLAQTRCEELQQHCEELVSVLPPCLRFCKASGRS